MQGGGGRSMAQRMNEKDAESERADGREDEKSGKECKCCRAKRRTQYLRNQNAGRLRQMERNVGRIAHHMGRNAGHVAPYQVWGDEGRP